MQIQSNYSEQMLTDSALTASSISKPPPPPPPSEKTDALSSYMQTLGQDEEVKSFMQEVMEMEQSGEFDAEALAASAPASMQAFAEENGLDLTTFFQDKHDSFSARSNSAGKAPLAERSESSLLAQYENLSSSDSTSDSLLNALKSRVGVDTIA